MFGIKIPKPILVGSALTAAFGVACMIKETIGGRNFRQDILATDKIVIITGANTGIGKETALDLARRQARVYMACRDMKRCEKAREEIVLDTKNQFVYCRQCDLANLDSIREFVSNFKEDKVDVLINNAGVMRTPHSKTKDGFEMQIGVNHFGHFLLTNLLLDKLKKAAPSRIINVSSIAHTRGQINKDDLNSDLKYDKADAYAQSKLANLLFTKELSKRLEGSGVTVNAIHPGIVDTELIRHMSFFNSWTATIFLKPFIWPFVKNPRQGAQTSIYAAVDPKLISVTGKYFSDYKETTVAPQAEDPIVSAWLWSVSEKWTRLIA